MASGARTASNIVNQRMINEALAEKRKMEKELAPTNLVGRDGLTPLIKAVLGKDTAQIRTLLARPELWINEVFPANGNTALHVAAWNGQLEILQLRLQHPQLDRNLHNKANQTAADLTREKGFAEIVRLLEK